MFTDSLHTRISVSVGETKLTHRTTRDDGFSGLKIPFTLENVPAR